jgi:hypothetical protein
MNNDYFLDLPVRKIALSKAQKLIKTYLKDRLLSIRYKNEFKKTKKLRDSQHGPALVMANGRRLKDGLEAGFERYPDLVNAKVMSINHFILHKNIVEVNPDYYLLLDPLYFNEDFSEDFIAKSAREGDCSFEDAQKDIFLSKKIKDLVVSDLSMKLFVPVGQHKKFDRDEVFPILGHTSTASKNYIDITLTLGWRTLSAYVALSIAKYLGHNPIYTAGFDNDSWRSITFDRGTNKTKYEFRHFYPEGSLSSRYTDTKPHELLASAASIHRLHEHIKVINLDPEGLF